MSFLVKRKINKIIKFLFGILLISIVAVLSAIATTNQMFYYRIFFGFLFFLTFTDINFHYVSFGFVVYVLTNLFIGFDYLEYALKSSLGFFDWALMYLLRDMLNKQQGKNILSIFSTISFGKSIVIIIFIYKCIVSTPMARGMELFGLNQTNLIGNLFLISHTKHIMIEVFLLKYQIFFQIFSIYTFIMPSFLFLFPAIILVFLHKSPNFLPCIMYSKYEDRLIDYIPPFIGCFSFMFILLFVRSEFWLLIGTILCTGLCSYFFWLGLAYLDVIRHESMFFSTSRLEFIVLLIMTVYRPFYNFANGSFGFLLVVWLFILVGMFEALSKIIKKGQINQFFN